MYKAKPSQQKDLAGASFKCQPISNELILTCTSTTWMESQHPLIFLDPSPAFLMRITPAKPCSKSQRYTEDTPPSKYLKKDRHEVTRGRLSSFTEISQWDFLGWYSQVSVLVKGVVGLNLEFPQARWRHCTIFNGRFILITPRGSDGLKRMIEVSVNKCLSKCLEM